MLRWSVSLLCGLLAAFVFSLPASAAGCDGDAECKSGRVCIAGRCAAKPKSCSKDAECPGDQICEQTRCVIPASEAGAAPQSSTKAPQAKGGIVDLELPPLVAAPTLLPQTPESNQGLRPVYAKETWPLLLTDRPLVLGKGMAEGTILLNKSLTSGSYDNLGLGLYAYYGADEKLTAGVGNVSFCLTGCGGGSFWQGISFDAHYLYYSDAGINVVPELSLYFQQLSPLAVALSPGVEIAYKLGSKVTLWVNPRFTLGLLGRGNSSSPDQLTISVQPRIALSDQLTLVPTLAWNLPLEATEGWLLPVGLGLHYAVSRALDVGGDLTLGTLIPRGPLGTFDVRTLRFFCTVRL